MDHVSQFRMFQETEDEKEAVFVEALSVALQRADCILSRISYPSRHLSQNFPLRSTRIGCLSNLANCSHSYPPLDRDMLAKRPEARKDRRCEGRSTDRRQSQVRYDSKLGKLIPLIRSPVSERRYYVMVRPWVPFRSGGWLDSFQSDIDKVVDWKNDGEASKGFSSASSSETIHSISRQDYRGIEHHQYPSNQTRMNARSYAEGTIFTISVNAIYSKPPRISVNSLGYLNSTVIFYLIRIFEIRRF